MLSEDWPVLLQCGGLFTGKCKFQQFLHDEILHKFYISWLYILHKDDKMPVGQGQVDRKAAAAKILLQLLFYPFASVCGLNYEAKHIFFWLLSM